MYVHDIKVGTTALDGKPEVVNETSATALVKGNNLLGPVSNRHQQYLALNLSNFVIIGKINMKRSS